MRKALFILLMVALVPLRGALAATPLELRAAAISEQLRCLVCQNQSIAESDAPLALDLRKQVREKLAQGASEREVIDFMTQRYGDFVLYKPPVKPATLLLWFGPLLLLLAGMGLLVRRVGRDGPQCAPCEEAVRLLHGGPT